MKIADSIRMLSKPDKPIGLMLGKVTKIDKDCHTCEVQLLTGEKLLEVRLRAVIESEQIGAIVYPEIGAFVSVLLFEDSHSEACLIQSSAFESVFIAIKDVFECSVNSDGEFLLKSDKIELGDSGGEPLVKGDTLNERIKELVAELRKLNQSLIQYTSTQGAASAGVLAPLAAGYSALTGQISPITGKLASIEAKLSEHLSQKTKTA